MDLDIPQRKTAQSQAEQRGAARRRVLRGAQLVFNGGASTVDVTIRDISDRGARVKASALFDCPRQVVLKMVDGAMHDAEVRWTRNLELGLHFTGRAAATRHSPLRVWGVYRELEKVAPATVLRELRALQFCGDAEIERLAESWQRTYEALVARLHPYTEEPPEEEP